MTCCFSCEPGTQKYLAKLACRSSCRIAKIRKTSPTSESQATSRVDEEEPYFSADKEKSEKNRQSPAVASHHPVDQQDHGNLVKAPEIACRFNYRLRKLKPRQSEASLSIFQKKKNGMPNLLRSKNAEKPGQSSRIGMPRITA